MVRRPARLIVFNASLGLGGFLLALLASFAFSPSVRAQDNSTPSIPLFVDDFDLSAAPATRPNPTDATKTPPAKDAPPPVFQPSDVPSVQARRLMDFFAITLVQDFQKAGYSATRQRSGALPTAGVLLRGVFGEADARNRIRRAMLGGGAPGARLLLYVGTFNLARPDQPLFQTVSAQSPDGRYGPVITLNNYIPLARFEVSKYPTEEEVRKISKQIVENLNTLLKTNSAAFAQ